MKVYELVTIDMNTGEVLDEVSYEYQGLVAMCSGGGGGSSTTYTQPPGWVREPMKKVVETAWGAEPNAQGKMVLTDSPTGFLSQPFTYYPEETVAGFSPYQQQAQQLTANRALQGSPLLGASQDELMRTMQGEYLSPESNPWLKGLYETAAGDVREQYEREIMPQLTDAAIGAGAYGGSRHGVMESYAADDFGETLSNLAAQIYAPAYESERDRMTQAIGLAPQLAEADYMDIGKLAAVGEEQQAMEQALIDEAIARHEFGQQEPWQRYGQFVNLISGDWGGTTATKTTGGGK